MPRPSSRLYGEDTHAWVDGSFGVLPARLDGVGAAADDLPSEIALEAPLGAGRTIRKGSTSLSALLATKGESKRTSHCEDRGVGARAAVIADPICWCYSTQCRVMEDGVA